MSVQSSIFFTSHATRLFIDLNAQGKPENWGRPTSSKSKGSLEKEWGYWNDSPCLILLGEPGSGKSTEFAYQFKQLRDQGSSAYLSLWRKWDDGDEDLFETLGPERDEFFKALQTTDTVYWFVDALDEGRLKAEKVNGVLKYALRCLKTQGFLPKIRFPIARVHN